MVLKKKRFFFVFVFVFVFVKKLKISRSLGSYNFVQISPACGPNTYQKMYGKTLDFEGQY